MFGRKDKVEKGLKEGIAEGRADIAPKKKRMKEYFNAVSSVREALEKLQADEGSQLSFSKYETDALDSPGTHFTTNIPILNDSKHQVLTVDIDQDRIRIVTDKTDTDLWGSIDSQAGTEEFTTGAEKSIESAVKLIARQAVKKGLVP